MAKFRKSLCCRSETTTPIVIKQDEKIKLLENKVSATYQREIKANLRISGLLENRNETRKELFEKISELFKETMEIEESIEIVDVCRVGTGNDRVVIVKLKYPNDKITILSHASNLKGKQNNKKQSWFIQEELTNDQAETRQRYKELIKEKQDAEQKLNIKMRKGSIMVNNETVKPKVSPPHHHR